jgi:O-antigen ligase
VTLDDLPPIALVGLALALTAAAIAAGAWLARRTRWAPSAGLALLIATPLVPHVPVVSGLSLDDVLPLLGVAFLAGAVDLGRLRAVRPPWLLVAGLVLLVGAGVVASLANASTPSQAVTMLLRSPVRYAFLAAIVALVALAEPADRRGSFVARGMALLGTAEAAFGLAAFFLPLGGLGLEPTRKFSVLYFEVPGRIAGTLGISPNFLGAIFVLTIVLTAGLAIAAETRRERLAWWAAVLVQSLALTLTFTRASLGLAIVALAVLLLLRGRVRYLVPVVAVVALGFLTTPGRSAEPGRPAQPGPSTPVAVERLTADVPDRLALWYSATLMMVDHPATGVGPGRTQEVARADEERYVETPFGSAVNNAHNTVLLAGAEAGIVAAIGAFIVNVAIALAALRVLLAGRRPGLPVVQTAGAIAVLGYLAQGMVNNLFTVAAAGIVFAVVAGSYVIRLETAPSARGVVEDRPVQRQLAPTGPPVEPIP